MPEIVSPMVVLILWAGIGYLLGSVPWGVIVARAMNLGDLRSIGSGNIGATNVLRTGNKTAAALTLLFDAGKAAVAVVLARWLAAEDAAQIAGLAAFVGHCFPIWLRFKGGKGVATYFGLLLMLDPVIGVLSGAIWLCVAAISRYSSLAALMAAGWTPVVIAITGRPEIFVLAAILGLLVYLRHWQNIARLRAGTETRIGGRKAN